MRRIRAAFFLPFFIRCFPSITFALLAVTAPLAGHGFVDDEIAMVSKKLEAAPDDADLLLRRATLHRAHDDYAAARADLKAVPRTSPRFLEAQLNLARLERENGHPADATAALAQYFAHGGDDPEAHREKARVLAGMGQRWEAVAAWREFLQTATAPTSDDFLELARLQVALDHRPDALQTAEDGLGQHPRAIPLHQLAASIHTFFDREVEAESHFATLRVLYPALLPRLYYEEGRIRHDHHQATRARSAWRLALHHLDQLSAARQNHPGFKELRRDILAALEP